METQTIVLVLVSLCGGAALVMLASAYRSISTEVNVADYEINRMEKGLVPGFTLTSKTRPLVIAKLEEFFREKSVIVRSQRLIDELFVFIYNGSRAEAMRGYNDDLVMSFSMGLWIRETALRLKAEGIELQKKAISGINSHQGVYTPEVNDNNSWTMEVKKQKESLEWLI